MVRYRDVINARPILLKLAQAKFSPRLSLRLSTALEQLFAAMDRFEKIKGEVIRDYFEIDPTTKQVKMEGEGDDRRPVLLDEKDLDEFTEAVEEALDVEVEGLTFKPLRVNQWPKSYEMEPREASSFVAVGLIPRDDEE